LLNQPPGQILIKVRLWSVQWGRRLLTKNAETCILAKVKQALSRVSCQGPTIRLLNDTEEVRPGARFTLRINPVFDDNPLQLSE
jgi:hypothetical protein